MPQVKDLNLSCEYTNRIISVLLDMMAVGDPIAVSWFFGDAILSRLLKHSVSQLLDVNTVQILIATYNRRHEI